MDFTINDSQEQIIRDRMIRAERKKCNDELKSTKGERSRKMRLARDLINDLEHHGPAGLVHIAALSKVTDRPIKIWTSTGCIDRVVGEDRIKDSVDVEYHSNNSDVGHWTLKGDKDPTDTEVDRNGCLFAVIASQIGANATDLRTATVQTLKRNIRILADRIDDVLWFEENDRAVLLIGGARYHGTSAGAAKRILDNSQDAFSHGYSSGPTGHPRGHASHPSATGRNDSVENYSRIPPSMKSGFLTRSEQDIVAHLALSHRDAQEGMDRLNRGMQNVAVTIAARKLTRNGTILPKMKEYYDGEPKTGEIDIIRVTLVLRHHKDRFDDHNADVLVHTFYPRRN